MKKLVEVEYVGIEDIQEIIDDAYDIMKHTRHHISISISNTNSGSVLINVYIMLDGFKEKKLYDYNYMFELDDSETSVDMMKSCKNTLKNLLAED